MITEEAIMKKTIAIISAVILGVSVLCGCGHEHSFNPATCTVPKTCSTCGYTEGTAVGHTVDIGKCANCSEYIGKDLAESILDKISSGNSKCYNGIEFISYGSATDFDAMYNETCRGNENLNEGCTYYEEAINLCGSYSELSSLKSKLQKVVDSCPSKPSSATYDSLMDYGSDYQVMITALSNLDKESQNFAKEISYTLIKAVH